MERLAHSTGDVPRQFARYAVAGMGLAALYGGAYWVAASVASIHAQIANAIGFLAALIAGYLVHSAWTFEGHEGRDHGAAVRRFVVVNVAGYGLNCFWVWLIVQRLDLTVELSVLPIVALTPLFTFSLNRCWTFPKA